MIWVVGGLVALLGLAGMILAAINGLLALRERLRGGEPYRVAQPIVTQEADRWATHSELMELREELRRIHDSGEVRRLSLEAKLEKLGDEERERIGKVHGRIDKVSEQIAGQGTVLDLIASRLNLKLGKDS